MECSAQLTELFCVGKSFETRGDPAGQRPGALKAQVNLGTAGEKPRFPDPNTEIALRGQKSRLLEMLEGLTPEFCPIVFNHTLFLIGLI